MGWIDWKRPSNRIGLFNTNNASESWFKQLLRSYLDGRMGWSIVRVLTVIVNTIWPRTELCIKYREEGVGRRSLSPSQQAQLDIDKKANSRKKMTSCVEDKNDFYWIKGGGIYRVRSTPMSCDCYYFLWFGKRCVHIALLDLFQAETSSDSDSLIIELSLSDEESLPPGPAPRAPPQRKPAKPGPKKLHRYALYKADLREAIYDETRVHKDSAFDDEWTAESSEDN